MKTWLNVILLIFLAMEFIGAIYDPGKYFREFITIALFLIAEETLMRGLRDETV